MSNPVVDTISDVSSSTNINIALRLEIKANNKIVIPGCEPSSAISSPTLAAGLNCPNPLVDLDAALKAIPGSWVEYGLNSGMGRCMKWYVLPSRDATCPCSPSTDYYQILRDLAVEDETVEEVTCDMLDIGFCKISDDADTYSYTTPGSEAGQLGGLLHWPPKWNNT